MTCVLEICNEELSTPEMCSSIKSDICSLLSNPNSNELENEFMNNYSITLSPVSDSSIFVLLMNTELEQIDIGEINIKTDANITSGIITFDDDAIAEFACELYYINDTPAPDKINEKYQETEIYIDTISNDYFKENQIENDEPAY